MSFTQDPHDNKILQLCRDGKVAEAIKLHKELTGAALKESKDYVDGLISKYGIMIPESNKACFIATVCYGNNDAPDVLILRQFRDGILLKTIWGKALVEVYYFVSPFFASIIANSGFLKKIIRKGLLEPIVFRIIKGVRIKY